MRQLIVQTSHFSNAPRVLTSAVQRYHSCWPSEGKWTLRSAAWPLDHRRFVSFHCLPSNIDQQRAAVSNRVSFVCSMKCDAPWKREVIRSFFMVDLSRRWRCYDFLCCFCCGCDVSWSKYLVTWRLIPPSSVSRHDDGFDKTWKMSAIATPVWPSNYRAVVAICCVLHFTVASLRSILLPEYPPYQAINPGTPLFI